MNVDMVADYQCVCGEGPIWHPEEEAVYWTDIPAGRLFRLDTRTGAHEIVYEDRPVGGFTRQVDGALLLFRDRGNVMVWRNGSRVRTVIESLPELSDTRFNDVCADPEGRVFCGTMSSPTLRGRLYRLDRDGSLHLLMEDLGTPNGMGFSPDLRRMYFNDSKTGTWVFDYDRQNGELSRRRLFRDARASGDPGCPDGLAVDSAGGVWTARWDGGCLLRFAPDGTREGTIELPARKVSSLCFAGSGLSDIYVTTAGGPHRETEGEGAGALFRIRNAGVVGLPRFCSRVSGGLP
jgi:D-xylonolactonase